MAKEDKYDHQEVEARWRSRWQEAHTYVADIKKAVKPFYNLWMFPYPSGEGLHAGHAFASTGSDVYGRFQRMQGREVFQPIGYDSFGIHSENYAIKIGSHPAKLIPELRARYQEQLQRMGHGYDWSRTVTTSDIDYYKWTQWVFVKMFEAGLALRKKAKVNWCPSCKTVLADEQVIDGKCERCSSEADQKDLEQWFFKMASGRRPNGKLYVESLLENLDDLDWSEIVKTSQKNWIGRKSGINIDYAIEGCSEKVTCFTTRPDTNFGATFIVIAPEHELVGKIVNGEIEVGSDRRSEVEGYAEKALKKTEQQRLVDEKKKTGAFTGLFAINGLNGYKLPIYVADFVLAGFGTGAVVGVPGHDKRDFEFATVFNLPVKRVVVASDGKSGEIESLSDVQEDEGRMINSQFLDGMDIHEATTKMMDHLEGKGWGRKIVSYHLRDWLISRQRYWGAPIPMVFCEKCQWQAIPESQLPVELPFLEDFKPTGTGVAPLAHLPTFVKASCPTCGAEARREADVCDTFLDSSWYFLRYPDATNEKMAFEASTTNKWLPVDRYTGGAEHANLHLLYARFVNMVMFDLGLVDFEEPFQSFRAHGLLIKDGHKMSKSKGNVISPDALLDQFGADTLRCYLMFIGPFEKSADFRDAGVAGMYRWLNRVRGTVLDETKLGAQSSPKTLKMLHQAIKTITQDIEDLKYNTMISTLMEVLNSWKQDGERLAVLDAVIFIKLLAPLAPYLTEELYQHLRRKLGEDEYSSVHTSSWPVYDETLAVPTDITVVVQVNGKMKLALVMSPEESQMQEEVAKQALANEKIKGLLTLGQYRVVFVPGRLINFVIS